MPVDAKRVQAVFQAAVEAGDPSAQAAVLDRECGADLELRHRVKTLLRAHRDLAGSRDQQGTVHFEMAPPAAAGASDSGIEARDAIEKALGDEAGAELGFDAATEPVGQVIPHGDSSAACPAVRLPGQATESDLTCQLDTAQQEPNRAFAADPGQTGEFLPPGDPNQTCNYERADALATPRPRDRLRATAPGPEGAVDSRQTGRPPPRANVNETGNYDRADLLAPPPAREGLPSRPPALEGVSVPGYEILEELGRGGMGVVYKARHLGLQRLVALKMILAGAHAGATGLARFRAEAEAVAQLQHPNIVQIYETGEHEGRPYFSLEFVEGGSLEQRMQETPTPPRAAAELVETLARTMDVAHQRGIVHRDLKPANILLGLGGGSSTVHRKAQQATAATSLALDHWSRNTVPKIADFGLVKRVNDDSSQTHSGTIIGTPSYMAPEQAEGKNREVGPPADIYALGAILYDLLTGRPPFKAGNPIDTIRQVIEQEPVPPRQLEPRVPLDLETICLKCLEKEPARRYASAGELAADLRRFLDEEPILARPTPAWERAWKWGKRRPAAVALLGVSVAALVGMVLFIVWHNVSLRGQLEQARAEERQARQREQEALEGQRLSRLHHEGEKLLEDARVAVAARDWPNARLHLTKALATIGTEPGLAEMKDPAQTLLNQVEHELRVEADRRASQARFQQFGNLRDEAQFLGTLYTGMDLAANLNATRAKVQQALAVYGVSAEKDARPALDAYLNDSQKADIAEDCFQLLLILAETQAQSASSQKSPEREQHLREALRLLEQALHFGQPSRAYHLRRARYLSLLGDRAPAAQAEKAAAEASVVHVLDHFLVADECYRRENFEEAIKEFNQVLQRKPAHFWAQYLNALSLLRLHRPAEATAQLSACIAQRTDFIWLYLLRGFAQGELQAYEAADADYQKASQMSQDDYSRYVLFVNRGALRVREERFDDAIADLKTAIELKPNEYQAYVNLAQAYRRLKKLDLALEQLQRAVQLEPALAHLYCLRARLYLERKEPALALKDFDQAIQRETTNSPFLVDDHVERGRLLLFDGKYPEALASFDAALRLHKEHSQAQRLRAEALFQMGRYQEVVEAFDRYLETGKPLESVYRGRGLALVELGKYPSAIEDFTRALELHPTSAVQASRGWAHLVCDAPKLALRDFELAIQLDPKNGDAHNGRGFVLATQGRYREAVRDAEEALQHGPQSPRLLYNAARIQAQCGGDNELRALRSIRQALGLLPPAQRPPFWSTYIRADAALAALRRYPQFQQLDADMSWRK
jgi:serine/threonine protein kinase/Flp pilus assembly protein TadD